MTKKSASTSKSGWQYRIVDTSTVAGLKTAEKLQRLGWKFTVHGLNKLQFYKKAK